MDTITHRLGSVRDLSLYPETAEGEIAPATAMQLRIEAGATCVVIDGTPNGTGGYTVPLTGLTLPVRPYRASIYADYGDGWVHEGDFALSIEGGC